MDALQRSVIGAGTVLAIEPESGCLLFLDVSKRGETVRAQWVGARSISEFTMRYNAEKFFETLAPRLSLVAVMSPN